MFKVKEEFYTPYVMTLLVFPHLFKTTCLCNDHLKQK